MIYYSYMLTTPITSEEQEYLERKFEHVLRLLDVSVLPDDQKRAWVVMLPKMKLEQTNRLIAILEKELYKNLELAQERPEDQRFIDQLNEAKKFHEEEMGNIQKRTLKALQDIETELPNVSQP